MPNQPTFEDRRLQAFRLLCLASEWLRYDNNSDLSGRIPTPEQADALREASRLVVEARTALGRAEAA